jgi:hypothetical protein
MASKYRIDLGSSNFRRFIENDVLYVDKTLFIEHIINNPSQVLLFTRPRRMGKTLNLDTLRTFVDPQVPDSKELFKGLNIEKSPVYDKMGNHPVIWISFRDMKLDDKYDMYLKVLEDTILKYIPEKNISPSLNRILNNYSVHNLKGLRFLTENIYQVTDKRPYVIMDEYDKLVMDSAAEGKDALKEALDFTKGIMGPVLKDNPYLEKGVITGVNRIAQESLFSDLNNIKIDGVFQTSEFDTDFGFTDDEVSKLVDDEEELEAARNWYNGFRIGESKIYFAYSVMGYLDAGEFGTYWGKSGNLDSIIKLLTNERIESISKVLSNEKIKETVGDRLSMEDLYSLNRQAAFYSLLVQTGYLTYDRTDLDRGKYDPPSNIFLLSCSNIELQKVWKEWILDKIYATNFYNIINAFDYRDNLAIFQGRFQELLTNKLSYFDFQQETKEAIYHSYVLGLLAGAGYKPKSNKESGLGRYDIFVEVNDKAYIFEFKQINDPEKIEDAAATALKQIREKKYYQELEPSCAEETCSNKPIILVGIGFCGKANWVTAEKL